jgi:hypothetical protein
LRASQFPRCFQSHDACNLIIAFYEFIRLFVEFCLVTYIAENIIESVNGVFITGSPAGLLVREVLKWKTSTTYQSRIHESIDLKLGKVVYVTRFTNFAKFGKNCISGGAPTWW